jgi:hypothetical protein
MQWSKDLRSNIDKFCDIILVVAVILYLAGKTLPESIVLHLAFWINLGLASIYLFERSGERYGIDYIAYI